MRALTCFCALALGSSLLAADAHATPSLANTAEVLTPGFGSVVFEAGGRFFPDPGFGGYIGFGVGLTQRFDLQVKGGYDAARGLPYLGIDFEGALIPDREGPAPAMSLAFGVHGLWGVGFDLTWMVSKEFGRRVRVTPYFAIDVDAEFTPWDWWTDPNALPFPRLALGGTDRRILDASLPVGSWFFFPSIGPVFGLAIRPPGQVELHLEGRFSFPRLDVGATLAVTVYMRRR